MLIAGAVFGYFFYTVSIPVTNEIANQAFIVEAGSTSRQIAKQLEEAGLIKNELYFVAYAILNGKAESMQAGVYEFDSSLSTKEIFERLSGGGVVGFDRITFPEGFTGVQIEERLIESGIEIQKGALTREVFSRSLEGYLFPDTYEINPAWDTKTILDVFLTNFEEKTRHLFSQKDAGLAGDLEDYEILILASLIEREVQTEEDMRLVSGVLHNRLEINMPLQVDATLVYLTGKKTGEITNQDKLIDSPYNTYAYRGLPPTPITNPGLRAIEAALEPTPTDYFYYLSAPDGTTIFSRTLEEHNINKARYLR